MRFLLFVVVLEAFLCLVHLEPLVHHLLGAMLPGAGPGHLPVVAVLALGLPGAAHGVAPARGRLTSVHLREEETQHSLAVFPVQVCELNSDALVRIQETRRLLLL